MKINFQFNKETLLKVGDGAWRLTKHIVKKGIQQTVMETAGSATLAMLDGDMDKAKGALTFDGIVGPKKVKDKKSKMKLFGRKTEEVGETGEKVIDILEKEAEIIDKK